MALSGDGPLPERRGGRSHRRCAPGRGALPHDEHASVLVPLVEDLDDLALGGQCVPHDRLHLAPSSRRRDSGMPLPLIIFFGADSEHCLGSLVFEPSSWEKGVDLPQWDRWICPSFVRGRERPSLPGAGRADGARSKKDVRSVIHCGSARKDILLGPGKSEVV